MGNLLRGLSSVFGQMEELARQAVWHPAADVYRTQDGWLIKFDLAGVRPEDLHLSVSGPHLTVKGMRRDWTVSQECRCYQMEISYSQFERQITLPVDLDNAEVQAEHHHGMLVVRIHQDQE